ncbi:N-methyl-L-tryptophan oxidase [Fructobacillus fructosus]|uniref:N-methyl-L-tryptophan oxidase n=1 Tax=Fructobacillus fructosus TaxID=1631 RepID=UPI0040349D7D
MGKVYDVAVIGTGSVGSAAGYYAAKEGLAVLELDSHRPPHEQGSHHGQTRIIRYAYGEGEKYLPLLLEAKKLWADLQEQSGQDIFHQVGVVNVGPKGADFIENVAHTADKFDLNVQFLEGQEINDAFPNLHFNDDYRAVYEKDAGYLHSEVAIETYLRLAEKLGVDQDFSSAVSSINYREDGLVVITNSQTTYLAKEVILTTGSWVKKLVPTLPITVKRKVFAWFKIDDQRLTEQRGFPAFTIEIAGDATYYGFPGENGDIKIGKHDGGQVITEPAERTTYGSYPEDKEEIKPLLAQYLTGTAGLDFGAACTYDVSPDEDFIIDQLPGHPQVKLVTSLSGHGFKFASFLGKVLADQVAGKDVFLDLKPFSLNRFQ